MVEHDLCWIPDPLAPESMKPFATLSKRLFAAGSLLMLAACSGNGITDPTAKSSGYLTVSAAVAVAPKPTSTTTTTTTSPKQPNTSLGYNVPAN
jgi:hypothetical protein